MTLSRTLIVRLEFSSRIADRRLTNDLAQREQAVLVLKSMSLPKENCDPKPNSIFCGITCDLALCGSKYFSDDYYSHKSQGPDLPKSSELSYMDIMKADDHSTVGSP